MIEKTWKRISGFHLEDNGVLGAVWLAEDDRSGSLYVYDAATFQREVSAVIIQGLCARGRHVPMAWRAHDKDMADMLLNEGLNVLPDSSPDNPGIAEIVSREIWQGIRASRFFVDERVTDWMAENRKYFLDDQKVPESGFPLMAATRHALQQIDYAEAAYTPTSNQKNHPGVRVI